MIRFSPVDLPGGTDSISFASGSKINDYVVGLQPKETVITVVALTGEPLALGTARGVVKRVDTSTFPARPDFSIINLDDGDRIVGASVAPDGLDAVFVTHATQVLHFPIAGVRAQGVGAAGVAGINLADGDQVAHFSVAAPETAQVVTVTAAEATLTGADPGRAKVTPLSEFPAKGRATGGVRGHSLLKGEVGLSLAWVGDEPRASAVDGTPRDLPAEPGKRDGSGTALTDAISVVGTRLR
jgi:DNA gyrase subunit A